MASGGSFGDRLWEGLTANLGVKLISIALAVVLWVIVLQSRVVEVTKEIPIEYITPTELVPGSDVPDRVLFRLSGPKGYLRGVLDRRENPIRVNLTGAKAGVVNYRIFSDSIRVPIGVKVLGINPSTIPIRLEPLKKRDVPVRLELRGTPPDGYRIVRSSVKPEVVRIKGAESRVDSVTEISTLPFDVTGIRASVDREVGLDLSRVNVQVEGALPHAVIDVEAASANYRIKNVDIRVLTPYKVKTDDKSVTVLVRAEQKDLKLLDRSHVYAVVDLTGKPKGNYTESIKVSVPEGVGLVKVIPDHVKVTLY